MIKKLLTKMTPFFRNAMVVLVASLFVISVVYAATTIGTNVTTEGDLTVTGASRLTMANATTTNVGTLTVYTGSTFTGLATFTDLRPAVLNATTTSVGTLKAFSTMSLTTSTATTTPGIFAQNNTATSTLSAGIATSAATTDTPGCLELVREGAYYGCFINATVDGIICKAGRCNN